MATVWETPIALAIAATTWTEERLDLALEKDAVEDWQRLIVARQIVVGLDLPSELSSLPDVLARAALTLWVSKPPF